MKKTPILLVLVGALLAIPAASAHVTVNPERCRRTASPALRSVSPTKPDAQTMKVTVQLPENLSSVSFQPKPGWKRSVTTVKLAKPMTNDEGETVTELRIATVTWERRRDRPR